MVGFMLTFRSQRWGGYKFTYCSILDSEDSFEFKHTAMWRPQKAEVYGDKDVSHRKMIGTIKPGELDGYPFPWSGTDDYRASGNHIVNTWSCGTESCYYKHHEFTGSATSEEVREYRVVDDDDYKYIEMRTGSANYYGRNEQFDLDLDYSAWTRRNMPYKDKAMNRWYTRGTWNTYFVSFKVVQPVPYYWRDYMDEIRPNYDRNEYAGLLSEIIRNTIAENTSYNTNNYANLLEVIDLVNDFRKGKLVELVDNVKSFYQEATAVLGHVDGKNLRTALFDYNKQGAKSLANGWLQYRYVYNTTKMDVEQYTRAKFGEYLGNLTYDRVLRGHGQVDNGTINVKMRLHDNTAPNFEKILIGMEQYGLFPGLYNLWDIIPFSFIADWFSNLGNYLEDFDQRIFFQYYKVDELLVSYKQTLDRQEFWGLTHYVWYDRFLLDSMPQWEFYEDEEVKGKTVLKRVTDAVSLVVGVL